MTYFDIESILAEEELIPCTTLFDFSHLGHLEDSSSSSGTARASSTETQYLKEGTKLKMPLWAMEKWASLRYVKVHLPRHLNQKARERWEADPLAVDLRKHNPHFFRSANQVISILEQQHQKQSSSTIDDDAGLSALRRLLLQTYTGPRLTATLDWSWCCAAADDGSSSNSHYYTHTLTEMERTLFRAGASGTGAHLRWKYFGARWFGQQRQHGSGRRRQAQVAADAQLLVQETADKQNSLLRDGPTDKRQRVK
ncbi:hypothetical protein MHU86_14488 [Fragilaria crotonensis]|nr:hypothetical protein MHU86_14488 [Fragilaria crotonensis]